MAGLIPIRLLELSAVAKDQEVSVVHAVRQVAYWRVCSRSLRYTTWTLPVLSAPMALEEPTLPRSSVSGALQLAASAQLLAH